MELRKSFKFCAGEEVAAHNIFYLQWKARWLGIIILSGFSSRLCGIDFVCAASFGADIKMSQNMRGGYFLRVQYLVCENMRGNRMEIPHWHKTQIPSHGKILILNFSISPASL